MPIGDVYNLRVKATFDGEPIINSLSFVNVGIDGGTTLEDQIQLAAAFAATMGLDGTGPGPWTTGLSVQYVAKTIEVGDVVPGLAPSYQLAVDMPGTVTDDDAMPPNDSLCITWRSVFKGPSGRGRNYLTGFAEGAANGGYWEAGTQAFATTIADLILATWGETGTDVWRFVVLHRYAGGTPIVPPEQKPVMSYTVHNEVRSIGRRAVGRRIRRHRVTP
jgi:hypothetical protein